MIGEFDFDLSYIYFKKDHVFLHQWLALANPNSSNYNKIQAYLKISISVACTGDEQVQIPEDPEPDANTHVMMSPSLNPKFYQIKIRMFQG